jgi:hypothetical protein
MDLTSPSPATPPLVGIDQHTALDHIQRQMLSVEQADCPVVHTFVPGLYARQCTMPANSLILSKIHKTEHVFVVSKGKLTVFVSEEEGWKTIQAPYQGVTKPGTRRIAFIHEETVWTTFHPTDKETPDEVEADIIEPRELEPLTAGEQRFIQEVGGPLCHGSQRASPSVERLLERAGAC